MFDSYQLLSFCSLPQRCHVVLFVSPLPCPVGGTCCPTPGILSSRSYLTAGSIVVLSKQTDQTCLITAEKTRHKQYHLTLLRTAAGRQQPKYVKANLFIYEPFQKKSINHYLGPVATSIMTCLVILLDMLRVLGHKHFISLTCFG